MRGAARATRRRILLAAPVAAAGVVALRMGLGAKPVYDTGTGRTTR